MRNFIPIIFSAVFILFLVNSYGQGGMIVPPGTKVTVGQNTTLDIGGDKLLLQDDFSTVPSFLQYGTVSFSGGGQAYLEQYLTKDVWHMVSSPVSNEVNEVYLWNYLVQFIEPTGGWIYLNLPLNIPLNVGEGYFDWNYTVDPNGLWPASPDSAVFKGALNYQDVNLVLSNTDASPSSGWNLLGNPFPVALEWNGHTDWNLNNVAATMYIFDNSGGGNYLTWNYNLGNGTNPNGGFIAATQGFWVRTADTTGTAASLTIPASQRFHNNATFLKSGNEMLADQLMITATGNGQMDKTIVGFYELASETYDPQFDGLYLKPNVESISLYSALKGYRYALNEMSSIQNCSSVPLSFEVISSGIHKLVFSGIESFSQDQQIYLEDKKDHVIIDLQEQTEYEFFGDPDDLKSRFVIHFTEPTIADNPMDYIRIFSYEKVVYVEIPYEVDGSIQIFDITGRKVREDNANMGENQISIKQSSGNYIVKVVANDGVVSEKVFIQ